MAKLTLVSDVVLWECLNARFDVLIGWVISVNASWRLDMLNATNVQCAVLAVIVTAGLLAEVSHGGDCEPGWLPGDGVSGVNGTVYAMTTWDPDGEGPSEPWLIVGGRFSLAGDVPVSNIAAWDGTAWHALGGGIGGPASTSRVLALCVFNGELIAGGSNIRTAGDVDVNGIARWDGQSWQTLGAGVDGFGGDVEAIIVHNDELIVAGNFINAGGINANRIASWDGDEWDAFGSGMNHRVTSLAIYDGDLFAGGIFTLAGGVSALRIARWDGMSWHPVGSGISSSAGAAAIRALEVYDNELVAGGFFDVAGGTSANHIARWNGTSWQALGQGVSGGSVHALTIYDDVLIAAGHFESTGTAATNHIAQWDGASWHTVGGGTNSSARAVHVYGNVLMAGGNFGVAGDTGASNIAQWDGSAWSRLGTNNGLNSPIYDVIVHNDELIACGAFTGIGDTQANRLARWTGTSWAPFSADGFHYGDWPLQPYTTVNALLVMDHDLIVGGLFDSVGNIAANSIARWDGSAWHTYGYGIHGIVNALHVHEGNLIVAGVFNTAGDVPATNVAQWDGQQWQGLGAGIDGEIVALAVHDGHLIAGGEIIDGVKYWDGDAWVPLGGGLGCCINEMLVWDDKLVVASGPVLRCWDGESWSDLPGDLSGGVGVRATALGTFNEDLIVAGEFTMAGGVPAVNIARWNGTEWQPLGQGLNVGPNVVASFNDELVVGGSFTLAGDHVSAYFARWTDSGIPWIAAHPENVAPGCDGAASFTMTPASGYDDLLLQWRKDGRLLVSGPTPHGSVISGADTDTLSIDHVQQADLGVYDVMVSNRCGSVTSHPATLTISSCGDLNGDQVVNIFDLLILLGAWGDCADPGDCPADLNSDGVVNVFDLLNLLGNWGG